MSYSFATGKMMGRIERGQCPVCRCAVGPDCPSTAKTRGQRRAREKQAFRQEARAA